MSNDKTLATVKHGGCVQLGDAAERARFEAWARGIGACVDADEHGNYVDAHLNSARLGWDAALSAQPSPGGQGAVWVTDAMVDAALARYLELEPSEAENNPMGETTAKFMRQLLEAALAASQPEVK